MAKSKDASESPKTQKPLAWLHGEVKTPPFTEDGRREAGYLLRLLQQGEKLDMPQSEPLPVIGPRCGALRVPDEEHNWRIVYRVDVDAVLIVDVYPKKTRRIPEEVIDRCRRRLKTYDEIARQAAARVPKEQTRKKTR